MTFLAFTWLTLHISALVTLGSAVWLFARPEGEPLAAVGGLAGIAGILVSMLAQAVGVAVG